MKKKCEPTLRWLMWTLLYVWMWSRWTTLMPTKNALKKNKKCTTNSSFSLIHFFFTRTLHLLVILLSLVFFICLRCIVYVLRWWKALRFRTKNTYSKWNSFSIRFFLLRIENACPFFYSIICIEHTLCFYCSHIFTEYYFTSTITVTKVRKRKAKGK